MTTDTIRGRAPRRPLKSPLAVASAYAASAAASTVDAASPAHESVVLSIREATLAEFEDYPRTTNNRDGRPYEEASINAYLSPGKNLDKWLAAQGTDADFTAVDAATLNRYFREYYLKHGQGGTHTLQRNLLQLFNFLESERGCLNPYANGLNRYAEVKGGGREWDWAETGTRHVPGIRPADVEELVARGAGAVVLSQGMEKRLQVDATTYEYLERHSITVHTAETNEAVRIYNELAEESVKVGGLFHSTC